MAATAAIEGEERRGGGRRRLGLLAGGGVLLLGGGAAAAFLLGIPPLRGRPEVQEAAPAPVFVEIPDIVANLNTAGRRQTFVRLRSKIEVARAGDAASVQSAMPRLLDMFTTYLRETRPEELRGSAGAHRLREELIARANIATRPGLVTDILFVELIIQ